MSWRGHLDARPSHRAEREVTALARSAVLILTTFVVGTVGFKVLAGPTYTWGQAIFMTAITLTTVGYGETIPVSDDPMRMAFTVTLLVLGVGSFLYFFSNVTAFFVEGTLDRFFWRRKMMQAIDRLQGHFVVCGGGNTGEHVIRELLNTDRAFVLIEQDPERIEALQLQLDTNFAAIVGDATDDEVLIAAGLPRARGIISCVSSDKDNLVVTFSARDINTEARIVARCVEDKSREKLRRAGADAVVSPDHIGGLRMVSEMARPTAVSFLDMMLRHEAGLRVEDVKVDPGAALVGATVGSLDAQALSPFLVVAISDAEGTWTFDPPKETEVTAGASLVFISDARVRALVEAQATSAVASRLEAHIARSNE